MALAELTGSKAHERFTGPQIMRWRKEDITAYRKTSRISLCSSFITTLLCANGKITGIDESDACGMNMWTMNRPERGWNMGILAVIAGQEGSEDLAAKLGDVVTDGGQVEGHLGRWFVERYGFHEECLVFPGTGDNPATLLSLSREYRERRTRPDALQSSRPKASSPWELRMSSWYRHWHIVRTPSTMLFSIQHRSLRRPAQSRRHQTRRFKICVTSTCWSTRVSAEIVSTRLLKAADGSLAREHVRNQYFDASWDAFNAALEESRSVGGGASCTAFWWLLPEIIASPHPGAFSRI